MDLPNLNPLHGLEIQDWQQDPLADKVEWKPMRGGGTNFKTHKVRWFGEQRAVFLPTTGYQLFAGVFLGAGLLTFFIFNMAQRSGWTWEFTLPSLFGLPFALVGVYLLRAGYRYIVFDFENGYFWRGRRSSDNIFKAPGGPSPKIPLEEIHALQLLKESVGDYYSYELNLILRDGSREHVIDHGSPADLKAEALEIGQFLGIPVWLGKGV